MEDNESSTLKSDTKQSLNIVSTGAINSSINLNTTTINNSRSNKTSNLAETVNNEKWRWDEIDITPLEYIGFNRNILQSVIGKNSLEIVQESINQFAFGLKNNGDAKKYENNA